MSEILKIFNYKVNLSDKFLIIIISIIPLSLAVSIFAADLLASISGLILIIKILRKDFIIFKSIKKEVIYFSFFYLILLISFFLIYYKK